MTRPLIRRALPRDAALLTDLAARSEAHWGCDSAFMKMFRESYRITEAFIARNPAFVAEKDGAPVGFYALEGTSLEYFYLEPAWIGKGLGRILWNHLAEQCRQQQLRAIQMVCSPEPKAFYLKMGAEEIGEADSRVTPGRKVSKLAYRLG